jgi:hypothetical protein
MKKHLRPWVHLALAVLTTMFSVLAFGQAAQTPAQPTVAPGVPRLVKFGGVLKDASGNLLTNTVGITFAIYSEQTGGAPLWQETQNVQFTQGRYTVFLGESTSAGIPPELFASGQPRWLGVRPQLSGEEEQPRVLLASVPYALKAVDADTLGGLPASAFLQANAGNVTSIVEAPTTAAGSGTGGVKRPSSSNVTTSGGTVGHIPYFTTSTDIENSAIFQSGTGTSAKIGIGTTTPASPLNISEPGVWSNTQGNDNLLASINGCNPGASFYGSGQDNYYTTAVGGCLNVPSSGVGVPATFGVMGIVNDPNAGTPAAGGYFQGLATGSTFGVWGLNSLTSGNCTSPCTPKNIIGYEDDIGPGNSNTTASQILGIQITGGSGGGKVPAGFAATAIVVEPSAPQWSWHYGFATSAGAIDTAAIFLDCTSGSRQNCPSQSQQFQSWDNNKVNHIAALQVDTSGNLDLTFAPFPGEESFNVAGNLTVTGSITAGTKDFKIDHPLDPANKYLYHTSVESPDMKNIYDGTIVLDANGEGEIQLPEYFEALNQDFRYQLTCIGGFAPVYVAQEIKNNSFRIGGGTSGLKVSWQVTGIRHDAYAESHRGPVEVEKPVEERGHYLHPELFGASPDKAIGAH